MCIDGRWDPRVGTGDGRAELMTHQTDYFISYNKADSGWAKWIAWTLESEGHSIRDQAWDFRPGQNFVLEMHAALASTRRVLALLSADYFESAFCRSEWASAFACDPVGWGRVLTPIRVRPCEPDGLLTSIIYIDLVGLSRDEARVRLLRGLDTRRVRPLVEPPFPGGIK
jgi:TIR domain